MKNENEDFCTDFLFADTSIVAGAGSVINVFGNYYDFNYSKSEEEADIKAIKCDWYMIGKDIRKALREDPSFCAH